MILYLRRVAPEDNCRRHYLLAWQYDLAGQLFVVRCWGRIGAPGWQGRLMTPVASAEEATRITRKVLKRRRRHGYQIVEGEGVQGELFVQENQ